MVDAVRVGVVKSAVDASEVPPVAISYQRYSWVTVAPEADIGTVPGPHRLPGMGAGGAGGMQKFVALVVLLHPMVTSKGPGVAPTGMVMVKLVAVDAVMGALIPLILTVLLKGVIKLVPEMTTEVPMDPDDGENEVIDGIVISPITFRRMETMPVLVTKSAFPSPSMSPIVNKPVDAVVMMVGALYEEPSMKPELAVFL